MKEKDLIEYIARQLVDKPDKVYVKETRGASVTVLELHVDREDMGRVIGKDGRVANALRTILRVDGAVIGRGRGTQDGRNSARCLTAFTTKNQRT